MCVNGPHIYKERLSSTHLKGNMPPPRSPTLRAIHSFRLGYNPWAPHPYPGLWTTPLIVCVFAFLAVFLVCINVPLSAYEFIHQVTYRPNDTLPALPLSAWVPSVIQPPTGAFEPQVLTVGDTLMLNNSAIKFTISNAFDRTNNNTPVSTFTYYNNPFSEGCDVRNMSFAYYSAGYQSEFEPTFSAQVVCDFPKTQLTLTWEDSLPNRKSPQLPFSGDINDLLYSMERDLVFVLNAAYSNVGSTTTNLELHYDVAPVCMDAQQSSAPDDDDCLKTQRLGFRSIERTFSILNSNGTDVADDETFPVGPGYSENNRTNAVEPFPVPVVPGMTLTPEDVSAVIQNRLQTRFHFLRLQLGVIYPNQIFNSSDMFNQSILPVVVPGGFRANESRASMANETFFVQVQEAVQRFNLTDRVPVMEYSRTVPMLKPIGSAVTSVFVSTFAMLSTIWAIFSLLAGALARMYVERRQQAGEIKSSVVHHDMEFDDGEDRKMGKNLEYSYAYSLDDDSASGQSSYEMRSLSQRFKLMELKMRKMQDVLRKRGMMEEEGMA
ncbi:hypothetical protein R3P38DRAFT_2745806 [Favolaschia claudopus]|uniref:Uncharacterized protein n=1 Tax=Favolaschia claudopus TaxID=2862362 RepID=A0AAV9ZIF1_9AGAR